VGTILKKPDLFTQGFRPGVVYINGEYWGIHNIRERIDKRYLKVHFDLEEEEVDFIDDFREVKEGTIDEWNDLTTFLENNSFENTANLEELAKRVDLKQYMDYVIFNLYIDNH